MIAFNGFHNSVLVAFYLNCEDDGHKAVIRRVLRKRETSIKLLKDKPGKVTPAQTKAIADLCSTDLRTVETEDEAAEVEAPAAKPAKAAKAAPVKNKKASKAA